MQSRECIRERVERDKDKQERDTHRQQRDDVCFRILGEKGTEQETQKWAREG